MEGLLERGRSSWYLRDGAFVLALAAVFVVVQLLLFAVGWAEGFWIPFGFCAAASVLVALPILAVGTRAWRCRACGVGLHPDRYLEVSEAALPQVTEALVAGDGQAIVAAVHAHPRGTAKRWWRLRIEHCPSCRRVALVRLERDKAFAKDWPEPKAMQGDGVFALLQIAEIDLPS